MTGTMTRDELRALAGQANITMQEALKRKGLGSDEYRDALAEYVRISEALAAAPKTPATATRSTRRAVSRPAGRCPAYTADNGCPLHGETCAPEYR